MTLAKRNICSMSCRRSKGEQGGPRRRRSNADFHRGRASVRHDLAGADARRTSGGVAALGELYDFTSAMRCTTDHHCKGVVDVTLVERAPNADLSAAGQRYLDGVRWRLGGSRYFTDKLPSNFLNIGFISAGSTAGENSAHGSRSGGDLLFQSARAVFRCELRTAMTLVSSRITTAGMPS